MKKIEQINSKLTFVKLLLLLLLLLLLTAIEFSLGGSSPYTGTDKKDEKKYIYT